MDDVSTFAWAFPGRGEFLCHLGQTRSFETGPKRGQ